MQSFRTVRIPAVRGKITSTANGTALAENRPTLTYNVVYLDELRKVLERSPCAGQSSRASVFSTRVRGGRAKTFSKKARKKKKKPNARKDKKANLHLSPEGKWMWLRAAKPRYEKYQQRGSAKSASDWEQPFKLCQPTSSAITRKACALHSHRTQI